MEQILRSFSSSPCARCGRGTVPRSGIFELVYHPAVHRDSMMKKTAFVEVCSFMSKKGGGHRTLSSLLSLSFPKKNPLSPPPLSLPPCSLSPTVRLAQPNLQCIQFDFHSRTRRRSCHGARIPSFTYTSTANRRDNQSKFFTKSRMRPDMAGLPSNFILKIHPVVVSDKSSLAGTSDEDDHDIIENTSESVYAELKSISTKLRVHDEIYYNSDNIQHVCTGGHHRDHFQNRHGMVGSEKLSDDEYDALARRESDLCNRFPHLVERLERESGLGNKATRFGGRIGPIFSVSDVGYENELKDNNEEGERKKPTTATTSTSIATTSASSMDGRKRKHARAMLSLDNALNEEEALKWIDRVRKLLLHGSKGKDTLMEVEEEADGIVMDSGCDDENNVINILAEPKLDGLSLSLRYRLVSEYEENKEDGRLYVLEWGATRGDGTRGDDVTEAVMQVPSTAIPKSFRVFIAAAAASTSLLNSFSLLPSYIDIRGEIVLPISSFKALNRNRTKRRRQRQYRGGMGYSGGGEYLDLTTSQSFLGDDKTEEAKENDESAQSPTPAAEEALPAFANARNAASGILQRKDDIGRRLCSELVFYAYDIAFGPPFSGSSSEEEEEGEEADVGSGAARNEMMLFGSTASEMRDFLVELGFHVPNPFGVVSVPLLHPKQGEDGQDGPRDQDREQKSHGGADDTIAGLFDFYRSILQMKRDKDVYAQGGATGANDRNENTKTLDYEVDGVVYKVENLAARTKCGSSNRAPRWAIAHKFPPSHGVTKMLDLEVQVGRTGALTPIAVLEPVDIGGTAVSRASLHNFYYAANVLTDSATLLEWASEEEEEEEDDEKGTEEKEKEDSVLATSFPTSSSLGVKVGTLVFVARAGDVIPQVIRRASLNTPSAYVAEDASPNADVTTPRQMTFVSKGGHGVEEQEKDPDRRRKEYISLQPPMTCPACGSKTVFETPIQRRRNRDKSGGGGGRILRCAGSQLECEPRAVAALSHAFSRDALDIGGLSKKRIGQLRSEGILRHPADIFKLVEEVQETNRDRARVQDLLKQVASLPGWGIKSASNLSNAARKVALAGLPLNKFIYSLGVRHVGVHTSKLIARAYGNVDDFLAAVQDSASASSAAAAAAVAAAEKQGLNGTITQEGVEGEGKHFVSLTGTRWGGNTEGEKGGGVIGMGPAALSSLVAFSEEEGSVRAARNLAHAIPILDDRVDDEGFDITRSDDDYKERPFLGWSVVFTGTIPGMTRVQAKQLAMAMGAKSTPAAVSKSTGLLVVGGQDSRQEQGDDDVNGGNDGSIMNEGKKTIQAREWGIRTMKAADFLDLARSQKMLRI